MDFDWIVVGAGAAGIASVGKLMDFGVESKKIAWIDPHFSVGDLGLKYSHVPSNTRVSLFVRFLNNCKAFDYKNNFEIDRLNPHDNCNLEYIVKPLQWITEQLLKKVHPFPDFAMAANLENGSWEVKLKSGKTLRGKKVILAIGAEPKKLSYPISGLIPVETALDPEKLAKVVTSEDTVGVFGSSHTAFLVLANLLDLNIKSINFYRSPHRYAVYLEDQILYDDTGLKGFTAKWAKTNIDGTLPETIKRIPISARAFEESLAFCDKVIYATGFERRRTPVLEQYGPTGYDENTGIIAPNLYGVGIAFPQAKMNKWGHIEKRVGLWKFMDYLNLVMPIWIVP